MTTFFVFMAGFGVGYVIGGVSIFAVLGLWAILGGNNGRADDDE